MKNMPQRTCTGCKQKKDKKDLIRVVCDKEGNISIDKTGKMQGRGAYICNNDCFQKAVKTKSLERTLKIKINDEIYENLRGVFIDKKRKM